MELPELKVTTVPIFSGVAEVEAARLHYWMY
jgi:hypothetical protein